MHRYEYCVIVFLITCFAVFALLFLVLKVNAEPITLEWDTPEGQIDGVRIYQKTAVEGDSYDYSNPVADIPFPGNAAVLEVPGEPDAVLKYQWVARAYQGQNSSEDSNEVSYKVINIPPIVPVDLVAVHQGTTIILSWGQPLDPYPIDHWIVYAKSGGDFEEIGTVDDANNLELITGMETLAPVGQQTELTFTVVAFRRSGVFSSNSTEASVIVDRRDVPVIENLRIRIEIPL